MRTWLFVLVTFAIMATQSHAQQNGVSNDIQTKLQEREKSFNNCQVDWHLTLLTSQSSASPVNTAKIRKQLPEQIRRDLKKGYGITDPKVTQKYVDARVTSALEASSAYQVTAGSLWHWMNYNGTTAVSGMVQDSPSLRTSFVYYYRDDWGLYVNTESFDPSTGKKASLDEPAVWNNQDGVLSSPVPNAPYLKPGDGVFLFGRNPLNAYKAKWQVVSNTPNAIVLGAKVIEEGSHPLDLHLTLDPSHGMAASQLDIVRGKHKSAYRVLGFGMNDKIWSPKQVNFFSSLGDGFTSSAEWRFVQAKPSMPIPIRITSASDFVTDYRLLDDSLPPMALLDEQQRPDSKVVSYRWKGEVLTHQQLQDKYNLDHPGEAASDSGQSNSVPLGLGTPAARSNLISLVLPFLGGALLIIGGVWMFKQRKAN